METCLKNIEQGKAATAVLEHIKETLLYIFPLCYVTVSQEGSMSNQTHSLM